MIAWEYHIMEEVDPDELQRLGELGWELAAIWAGSKQVAEFDIPIAFFYFKRPLHMSVEEIRTNLAKLNPGAESIPAPEKMRNAAKLKSR